MDKALFQSNPVKVCPSKGLPVGSVVGRTRMRKEKMTPAMASTCGTVRGVMASPREKKVRGIDREPNPYAAENRRKKRAPTFSLFILW